MTYRLLPIDEWPRLVDVFNALGHPVPPPTTASVAVAESDGKIVGVLVLQVALHMEPLILTSPHASFLKLQATLERSMADRLPPESPLTYYAFSDGVRMEQMIAKSGLEEVDGRKVWQKQITKSDKEEAA